MKVILLLLTLILFPFLPAQASAPDRIEPIQVEQESVAKEQTEPKEIKLSVSEQEAWNYIRSKEASSITSLNPTTYACGLPQANPCDKLLDAYGIKHDKPVEAWNYTREEAKALVAQVTEEQQLEWMRKYVMRRYGSFRKAMQFHIANGWY